MRKIYKTFIFLLLVAFIMISIPSCQNVFGSSTDSERVYGEWIYQKESGAGIKLNLNKDGNYYYEEFSSKGKVLYSYSGKFSLSSTRLILKDLDTSDDNRYSIFSISMKNSTEGMDILDLVPTMTKKYSFKRVISTDSLAPVSLEDRESSNIELDVEGEWQSSDFGMIAINENKVNVKFDDLSFVATIIEADGNNLTLSFPDTIVIDEVYSDVSYFIVNGMLYVVFPKLGSEAIVFNSI